MPRFTESLPDLSDEAGSTADERSGIKNPGPEVCCAIVSQQGVSLQWLERWHHRELLADHGRIPAAECGAHLSPWGSQPSRRRPMLAIPHESRGGYSLLEVPNRVHTELFSRREWRRGVIDKARSVAVPPQRPGVP